MSYSGLNSPTDYEQNMMTMRIIKPLTPAETASAASAGVPAFVIEAVNELLVEKYGSGSRAIITLEDIKSRTLQKMHLFYEELGALANEKIEFNMQWLNFEFLYEAQGWKVKYEKKYTGGNTPSRFIFTTWS